MNEGPRWEPVQPPTPPPSGPAPMGLGQVFEVGRRILRRHWGVLLLVAGNVMEPSSIVLILAPILFPVAMHLGIDPIHFGIIMVVNMEVGMCHPPVGLNLYVASGIAKMGITELTIAVWPWLLTMLVFLGLVTYIPAISLAFPRWLGMVH